MLESGRVVSVESKVEEKEEWVDGGEARSGVRKEARGMGEGSTFMGSCQEPRQNQSSWNCPRGGWDLLHSFGWVGGKMRQVYHLWELCLGFWLQGGSGQFCGEHIPQQGAWIPEGEKRS